MAGGKATGRLPGALALGLLALSALLTYNTVFTEARWTAPSPDATVTVPEVRFTGLAGEELLLPGQEPSPAGSPEDLPAYLLTAQVLMAAAVLGAALAVLAPEFSADPAPDRTRWGVPGPLRGTTRSREQRSRARAAPAGESRGAEGPRSGESASRGRASGSSRAAAGSPSVPPAAPLRGAAAGSPSVSPAAPLRGAAAALAAAVLLLIAAPALALDSSYNQSGYPSLRNGTVIAGVPANLNLSDGVTYDVAEDILRTNFTETFGTSTSAAGSNAGFEGGAAGQWAGTWYRQLSGTATAAAPTFSQLVESPAGTGLPAEGSWLYNESTDVRSTANCAGANCITIQYGRNYSSTSLPYPMNMTKSWNFSAYVRTNFMREVGNAAADTDITAAGVTFNLTLNGTDVRYLHYYIFAIAQATPANSSTDAYYFPFGTASRCTEPAAIGVDTACTDQSWARINVSNLSQDIQVAFPGLSTWSVNGIWFDEFQRFTNIRAGRTVILNASFDALQINETSPFVEAVYNSTNATLPQGTVLNFLNATLNFTSNRSGEFRVDLFNYVSGAYELCAFVQVAANQYSNLSCNVSTSPSNYISSAGNITLNVTSLRNNTTDLLVQDTVGYRLNFSDLWPPNATGSGTNRTVVHKNETILFNSTWADYVGLFGATLETNATLSGAAQNVSFNSSLQGTQSDANFTFGGLSNWLNVPPGAKSWRVFANDTNVTRNTNVTALQTLDLWGWADVTNTTPVANVSRGAVVTLTCRVLDRDNASAIAGYNVSFYRDTGLAVLLGGNLTNSTGVAAFNWNTSGAPGGAHYPTCVLESANATLYYNASEQDRANTTVSVNIPPTISGSSPTTDPENSPGAVRAFSITIDQAVDVSWTINGSAVSPAPDCSVSCTSSAWTNLSAQNGTWNISASVGNANGSAIRTWTWTVFDPPRITSFSPSEAGPTNSPLDASRTFTVFFNQQVNVSWLINGTNITGEHQGWDTDGTDDYINTSLAPGTWNITALVRNANGSDQRTWNWTVFAPPNITQCTPGGSPCPSNFSFSTSPAATTFGVTSDQAVNATWRINGTVVQTNYTTPATVVNYTNTSPVAGVWNVTIAVNNTNGTDTQTWLWSVFAAPAITDFQPSTPVSNGANVSRSFNITVDQAATIDWLINGTAVQTNSSVPAGTRVYYNNSSNVSGVWNITAVVSNVNGSAQQVWLWTVAPDIVSTSPASPVSDISGAARTFSASANQVVTFQWTIDGTSVQTNSSTTSATYNNTSAVVGTWNVTVEISNSNGSEQFSWTWTVSSPPVVRLIREQSNGTAANRVMTVDLYLVNPANSTSDATGTEIREFINSTWQVMNCGGCAFNNSTFINWTVGTLPINNHTRVSYTVRAPSVTGFYLFRSNATFVAGGTPQEVQAETDPWNVTVQSPRAMFEFEVDLNRADSDINRTLSNSSNQSATWTATNIGDSPIPDGENLTLRLEYNGSSLTLSEPTCALCLSSCAILTLAGPDRALECTVSNSSTAPGTVIRVNFTVNASVTTADEVLTSNATYDPPPLPVGTYVPPPEVVSGPPPAAVFEHVKPAPAPAPVPAPSTPPSPEPRAEPEGPLEALWGFLQGLFGGRQG